MKPIFVVAGPFVAFLVTACASGESGLSGSAQVASMSRESSGGRCLPEAASCRRDADCCTQSCENGSCVTRDP